VLPENPRCSYFHIENPHLLGAKYKTYCHGNLVSENYAPTQTHTHTFIYLFIACVKYSLPLPKRHFSIVIAGASRLKESMAAKISDTNPSAKKAGH
jgi:hypothetical protein